MHMHVQLKGTTFKNNGTSSHSLCCMSPCGIVDDDGIILEQVFVTGKCVGNELENGWKWREKSAGKWCEIASIDGGRDMIAAENESSRLYVMVFALFLQAS